jgi:hypothetical protein
LKKTPAPDRGTMATILTGEDDADARRHLASRMHTLKQRGFVRELADGRYDVLWEVEQ